MIYIHMKKGNLDLYITLKYDETYLDYMIQASEEIHKYLPFNWYLVDVKYNKET